MELNRVQRIVIGAAFVHAVLFALFPPWTYTTNYSFHQSVTDRSERPAGFVFIFTPPSPVFNSLPRDPQRKIGNGVRLNTAQLAVQYLALCFGAGGLFLALRSRPTHLLCLINWHKWRLVGVQGKKIHACFDVCARCGKWKSEKAEESARQLINEVTESAKEDD